MNACDAIGDERPHHGAHARRRTAGVRARVRGRRARASRRACASAIFEPFFTTKPVGQGHRPRPLDLPRHHRAPRRAHQRSSALPRAAPSSASTCPAWRASPRPRWRRRRASALASSPEVLARRPRLGRAGGRRSRASLRGTRTRERSVRFGTAWLQSVPRCPQDCELREECQVERGRPGIEDVGQEPLARGQAGRDIAPSGSRVTRAGRSSSSPPGLEDQPDQVCGAEELHSQKDLGRAQDDR